MRKLTHEEIVTRQKARINQPKLPFAVILNNIRSLYNVGSIFRTADGVGVEKIWLCGITGHPPDSKIAKTALGAEVTVNWDYSKEVFSVIRDYRKKDYQIVLLEQMEQSISCYQFIPKTPVCLVIGNEIAGISEELVSLCDVAVEIGMNGLKNSLNVSVAFGIIAYHIRHCLTTQHHVL